jgi:5-methylthioadenosine/S-adenosylhomocysteine deaminase
MRRMSPFKSPPQLGRKPLLIKGGVIISMDETIGNLEQGDVLIEGGKITAIAPSLPSKAADVIDARGMIVSPGFVDCHRHAWEAQFRHLNPNSNTLADYCCATHFSFAPHYQPIDNYVGGMLTAVGGIDAGITTFIDNAHNARSDEHALAGLNAWLDAGVRAVYAPGPPITGDWDEVGWPHQRLTRLRAALGATTLVTLGVMAQFVPEVWAFAREMKLPIVSEVPAPELAALIRAFDEQGLLGGDNIFNHITGLSPEALEILQRRGVRVNVCPRSDAQYGLGDGGMGSFQAAREAGLKPAFSIDNETSYSGDMFGEMRTEFFLQRAMIQRDRHGGKGNVPLAITVAEVLEAATIHGARCAGLDRVTGSLTPGKDADLIAIRANDLNLFPLNNAFGAIVHGAERGNIDTVIIAGRLRKHRGEIVGLDHDKLKSMVEDSRQRLFAAVGFKPELFCDYHQALAGQNPKFDKFWT